MTHVNVQPHGGATNSVGTGARPMDGIRPSSDTPARAAAEHLHVDPDDRINCGPNLVDGAPSSDASSDLQAPDPPDDSGQGLAMFVIFIGAALIVTGAVALLALVNSWWMLGVAFGIHVAMTAIVALTIYHAMASRTRTAAAGEEPLPAGPGRFEGRPGTGIEPMAAPGHAAAIVLAHRSESPAGRLGPPADTAPRRPRVLMVTDENLAEANEVPEPIRPLVDVAEEVYIVAPTLTGLASQSRGVVGDEDQVAAIGDALADFEADLVVLRLHARGGENENWREHRLAKRVRSRFGLPTIAFFFDGEGHVIPG